MTTAAIMQPTYLPWIGYFGLMDHVDEFVFLDSVQFAKRSWQQRNQVKTQNGPIWLSVPVHSKGARNQQICKVSIVKDGIFPSKHIRSIEASYSKSPYFSQYSSGLFELLSAGHDSLADLTISLIVWLRDQLGILTPFKRSSELSIEGSKADLLAGICSHLNIDHYISPLGSKDYMDQSDAFEKRGISVSYFHFAHPEYPQLSNDFLPYMSIIDLMFNAGPKSLSIIQSGYGRKLK